jgi:hypothetical protein
VRDIEPRLIYDGLVLGIKEGETVMAEKLAWEEIEKQYNQEWVELVDYDWPDGTPYPRAGVVRVHDGDRKRFHALVRTQRPAGSALLFVGTPAADERLVTSSLFRVVSCR